MSAPDTDVEKQARRHKTPLLGIAGSLIFAAIAGIVIAVFLFGYGGGAEDVNPVEPAAIDTAPPVSN